MASPEAQQWASNAALSALVRYGPQRAGLAELLRAARERFANTVNAGQSESTLGMQAAQQAIPATQAIFSKARAEGERAHNLVGPVLAALSANNPFKAAAANEEAAGTERLAQSESHALSDLQARSVAASELPSYTRANAMAALVKELSAINSKQSMLQGQEGADIASELGKQRREAAKDALTRRGQDLTHAAAEAGHETSEDNSERTAASQAAALAAKGAGKPLSTKEQDAALGTIGTIRRIIGKNPGKTRAQYVAKLTEGFPAVKEGAATIHPAIKGIRPNAVMAAALDESEFGYLTPNTEVRLRREGYDPSKLGVRQYQDRTPKGVTGGVQAGIPRRR